MPGPGSSAVFQGLLQRGYDPVHAAALTGNMVQESGVDPTNVNTKEDAHGLLQWRLDRWKGLQDYAAARGTDPTDTDTQLDYIGQEMGGPESKPGSKFMAATDLPSANAALKSYIRYGDHSDNARLNYANGVLNSNAGSNGSAVGPGASPAAAPGASASGAAPAPGAAPAGAGAMPGLLNAAGGDPSADANNPDVAALMQAAKAVQQPTPVAPFTPIQTPIPVGLNRARLLAAMQTPIGG